MRKTCEELMRDYYPSWNQEKHNIVEVMYGDSPLIIWNNDEYEKHKKLTGTLANINAVAAYMYLQNGEYSTYRTLLGEVHINAEGDVLAGDINIQYKGKRYSIILNKMYGWKALDILRIGQNVVGFSNKDGQGSPSRNAKELDKDVIEKVINMPLEDYGVAIQKIMRAVRELYYEDQSNFIMEKLFCV